MRTPRAALTAVTSLFLVLSVIGGIDDVASASGSGHRNPAGTFTPAAAPQSKPTRTPTATPTAATDSPSPTSSPTATATPDAPDNYTPPYGVRFNAPNGRRGARRRIIGHLIRTINSVPRGQKIRIATWNLNSDDLTHALIAAHRRGVSVRIVLDNINANPTNPNKNVNRLRRVLSSGQKSRRTGMKSLIKTCKASCRYPHGIAHTKFYLFTKAGAKTDIVMYGSANATDLAANGQWNDLYTFNGMPKFYDKFNEIFAQMRQDRRQKVPYQTISGGPYTAYFYPFRGPGTSGDPVLDELNAVTCHGATGGTGFHGRTKIRIAQTSMYSNRGEQIATKLRRLWEAGCDIKIVYAVFGNNVISILTHTSRGPVPIQQIVNDYNGDGIYEKYLHMKDMTISGNYDGKTDNEVTYNGSSNWTTVSLQSDEIVMRIYGHGVEKSYADYIDYLYSHPPVTAGRVAVVGALARLSLYVRGIDPNKNIELD